MNLTDAELICLRAHHTRDESTAILAVTAAGVSWTKLCRGLLDAKLLQWERDVRRYTTYHRVLTPSGRTALGLP